MSHKLSNLQADYLKRCRNTMRQKYGEPMYILITEKGDPALYPNGAWFDTYVNEPLQIVGVDEDHRPPLYILPNGESIPFEYAEVLNWLPPMAGNQGAVKICDEKKLYRRQDILEMLRLAFSDIPDDAELVISQSSPFFFADGAIVWLQLYRYPVDDYVVEFVASTHKVPGGKYCVVALDNGMGGCITLTRNAEVS